MFEHINNFLAYAVLFLIPVGVTFVFLHIKLRKTRERILRKSFDRQVASQRKYLDNLALKHKLELEKRERASKGIDETSVKAEEKMHTLDEINRIARMFNYVIYASSTQLNHDHIDDLLAVPWTNSACKPEKLIDALCTDMQLKVLGHMTEHDQRRFTVHLKSPLYEYFHLSVMKPCECKD